MSQLFSPIMRPLPSPLLRAAAEELQRQGGNLDAPIHVEVEGGGLHFTIDRLVHPSDLIPPPPPETTPMSAQPEEGDPPRQGKMFSAIEETILAAATEDWQTAQEFAAATGQKPNHWFYAILSNLVEREWLEGGRNGYRKPSR